MQALNIDSAADESVTRRRKTRYRTQANALLRKNVVYQARNRCTNVCVISMPILFILLLFGIQQAVNFTFGGRNNKCGCECLSCCDLVPDVNGTSFPPKCRVATAGAPCLPGSYTGDCRSYNDSNCGPIYSNSKNIQFCGIAEPSTWPPISQVPLADERALPFRPGTTSLYTGDNPSTSQAIASYLFPATNLSDPTAVTAATALFASGLAKKPITINADALRLLGYNLGTSSVSPSYYYQDVAFTGNQTVYNLEPSCGSASSNAATNLLTEVLTTRTIDLALIKSTPPGTSDLGQCVATSAVQLANVSAINRAIYCGFYQAHCNPSEPNAGNSYMYAFDFGNSTPNAFSLGLYYNDTNALNNTNQMPPVAQRVNSGLNLATNAFLHWTLGPNSTATLLGISEMPKAESSLHLDFASLLGPIFFTWLAQLILPVMLVSLVYEKQQGLRIMMKMHGLGDFAYYSVQYVWFLSLYLVYIAVLIIMGSAVNIGFFRQNSYGLQVVFYFVWGNCLVSFGFLASTIFTNVKTAVVVAYLWVVGTGLLGYLMFEQFLSRGYSWAWALEIIPSFALFRGLYEFSQYAFLAGYGNGQGLTFAALNDGYNGMSVAMGIMVIEWAVFLVLAWYFEQVLPSGTGVRRSPFFFLDRCIPGRGSRTSPLHTKDSLVNTMESPDVAEERARAEALRRDDPDASIVLRDLCKIYPAEGGSPPKVAVQALSMAIERGEVFGLLGPNGAGKTSAINMMIGLLEPSSGTATVEGYDIRHDMSAIYGLMGVCPQHDLLWDQLTASEHLYFYGRLKNLKGKPLADAVESGLRAVNLHNVKKKQVGTFSGGMKRRLSVAISFMGDPSVVYLDEPSTGLDPASRRNLWDVVKAARTGRGIILTTHSMEEAEVLCDRLGIFVDGRLVCVGAPKAIAARYGTYLVFTITVGHNPEALAAANALVLEMAPSARRTYALSGTQKYELPIAEVTLSKVFARMEAAKGSIEVLDWGVAHATLEEVFIKFARSIGAEGGDQGVAATV